MSHPGTASSEPQPEPEPEPEPGRQPKREPEREMLSLVTARVRDAHLRKPFYVDGHTDLDRKSIV